VGEKERERRRGREGERDLTVWIKTGVKVRESSISGNSIHEYSIGNLLLWLTKIPPVSTASLASRVGNTTYITKTTMTPTI